MITDARGVYRLLNEQRVTLSEYIVSAPDRLSDGQETLMLNSYVVHLCNVCDLLFTHLTAFSCAFSNTYDIYDKLIRKKIPGDFIAIPNQNHKKS